MFSTHLVTSSVSQPVPSHPCLPKASEEGTFPWDVWTYIEQCIADPCTFPGHFGLDWLTMNTQPGVWVSRKVRWVLVLASAGHPADTLIRLVGGIIWLAAWPECHSLGKPDFLERRCTWPWGKQQSTRGEARWKSPTLRESQTKGTWCWLVNESTNQGSNLCHHDLTSYQALGTAISLLSRWSHLMSTTALKGEQGFKKVPLLYLIWHSSLEGIAMAKCKTQVFITKKHV